MMDEMSDDELSALLDSYSSSSIKSIFKKQLTVMKNEPINVCDNNSGSTEAMFQPLPICQDASIVVIPEDSAHPLNISKDYEETECLDVSPAIDKNIVDSSFDDCIMIELENTQNHRYMTRKKRNTPSLRTSKPRKGKKATNRKTASAPMAEVEDSCNFAIKILWKSVKIVRLPLQMLQRMESVFQHFAKEENVSVDKILLTFDGKIIEPSDTPESLNLNLNDFIEGGVVDKLCVSAIAQEEKCDFFVKMQDSEKRIIKIAINIKDPLITAMRKFSNKVGKDVSTIKFLFDGYRINGNDTPEKLDFENGETIDVVH